MNLLDQICAWMRFLVFIALLLLSSEQDFKDEKAQEQEYCGYVKSGVWPDFKKIAKEACE